MYVTRRLCWWVFFRSPALSFTGLYYSGHRPHSLSLNHPSHPLLLLLAPDLVRVQFSNSHYCHVSSLLVRFRPIRSSNLAVVSIQPMVRCTVFTTHSLYRNMTHLVIIIWIVQFMSFIVIILLCWLRCEPNSAGYHSTGQNPGIWIRNWKKLTRTCFASFGALAITFATRKNIPLN